MAKVEVVKNKKANQPNYAWVEILIGFAIFYGIFTFFFNSSSGSSSNGDSSKKISGCYYITNDLLEDTGTSLCIGDSTTSFTYLGNSSTTLYSNWVGDTLYIENEYGDTLFKCTASKENSNSIQCKSNSKVLGTGTNVWKKD